MSYNNPFLKVNYAVDQQRTIFTFSLAQLCAYRTTSTRDGYYVCMQSLFDLACRLCKNASTTEGTQAILYPRVPFSGIEAEPSDS